MRFIGFALAALSMLGAGCTPTVSEGEGTGEGSLTTRLNAIDIQKAALDLIGRMHNAQNVMMITDRPTLAFNGVQNLTSQPITTGGIGEFMEGKILEEELFRLVDASKRDAFLNEIAASAGDEYGAVRPELGQLHGVQYFLYGKLTEDQERTADRMRSQYRLHMKLTNVSTSEVLWLDNWQWTKVLD